MSATNDGVIAASEVLSRIDADVRAQVVDALATTLVAHYVFPEVAARMSETLRERLAAGVYDQITGGRELAGALTAELQRVAPDRHLAVVFSSDPLPPLADGLPEPEEVAQMRREHADRNFGFAKVERLRGNVGYLKVDALCPAEDLEAGEVAAAAMTFLARTRALIIDLRENGGGHPSMVALLAGYLFDEPVHLNSIYSRVDDFTAQIWSAAFVSGRRYADRPVYLLTSGHTASAGEDLAYSLKASGRVTLVGETTLGAAHPSSPRRLHPHFDASVPYGRSVHPVTGSNWEGTGVAPDLAVPAAQALITAHRAALETIIRDTPPERSGARDEAQCALDAIDVDSAGNTVDDAR